MTVTSPLHPEFQGYYGEEGGGRGEPATRLSEPTDLSRLAGERGRGERPRGAPLVESPRRGVRGDRARPMTVEIRPAQRTDADTLTAIAHAAKRSWRYPEEWIRLCSNELTVTPDFIERNRVCCAQRGGQVVGFDALSGTGSTRELEHMWVAPEHPGVGIGAALFEHAVETARQRERRNSGSLQTRTPRVST